jgi:hypothetical protein
MYAHLNDVIASLTVRELRRQELCTQIQAIVILLLSDGSCLFLKLCSDIIK